MHGISPTDPGKRIDWSETSSDYGRHRPGYPTSFYARLEALGIGIAGQRVLDLGTGTGAVARELARRGCRVTGVDVAEGQITEARRLATQEGLDADFREGPAEETGLPDTSFDLITAAQCWLYFDRDRAVAEVRRLLAPGGRLITCHMCWLPRLDDVARRSEQLVLEHNPAWRGADFHGEVPASPAWIGDDFDVTAMFFYDEPVPFTRESWRGRIRACRGVGASLKPEAVTAFDEAHAALLETTAPERFSILHRIDAHVLAVRARAERS